MCAVIIGFDGDVLERAGLGEALGNDPAIILAGGHDPHGSELAPLDLERLADEVAAVAGHGRGVRGDRTVQRAQPASTSWRRPRSFATVTGKPVTLSHHLSARLNGPKRAVTAVLNARLISIIDGLVRTTETRAARAWRPRAADGGARRRLAGVGGVRARTADRDDPVRPGRQPGRRGASHRRSPTR